MEKDQSPLESCGQSSLERSENNPSESNDSNNDQTHYHEYQCSYSSIFKQHFRCYPISDSIPKYSHLANGDKIILPESALHRLSRMEIQYPMSFELRNPKTQKLTHCGVIEFSAEEGLALLPNWMMEKMGFEPGEISTIKNVNLVKGTYVKLQPHTTDFIRISDPKSVLETTLRMYSCLTAGDTIMIKHDDNKYYIDILETKPSSSAISIIETDCEVDFATPLDYKEPEKPAKKIEKEVAVAEEETKFRAFTGVGRRLDGTPVICPTLNQNSSSISTCLGKRKLVFGSSESADQQKSSKALKKLEEPNKENKDEKVFQAFTGNSYRLTN